MEDLFLSDEEKLWKMYFKQQKELDDVQKKYSSILQSKNDRTNEIQNYENQMLQLQESYKNLYKVYQDKDAALNQLLQQSQIKEQQIQKLQLSRQQVQDLQKELHQKQLEIQQMQIEKDEMKQQLEINTYSVVLEQQRNEDKINKLKQIRQSRNQQASNENKLLHEQIQKLENTIEEQQMIIQEKDKQLDQFDINQFLDRCNQIQMQNVYDKIGQKLQIPNIVEQNKALLQQQLLKNQKRDEKIAEQYKQVVFQVFALQDQITEKQFYIEDKISQFELSIQHSNLNLEQYLDLHNFHLQYGSSVQSLIHISNNQQDSQLHTEQQIQNQNTQQNCELEQIDQQTIPIINTNAQNVQNQISKQKQKLSNQQNTLLQQINNEQQQKVQYECDQIKNQINSQFEKNKSYLQDKQNKKKESLLKKQSGSVASRELIKIQQQLQEKIRKQQQQELLNLSRSPKIIPISAPFIQNNTEQMNSENFDEIFEVRDEIQNNETNNFVYQPPTQQYPEPEPVIMKDSIIQTDLDEEKSQEEEQIDIGQPQIEELSVQQSTQTQYAKDIQTDVPQLQQLVESPQQIEIVQKVQYVDSSQQVGQQQQFDIQQNKQVGQQQENENSKQSLSKQENITEENQTSQKIKYVLDDTEYTEPVKQQVKKQVITKQLQSQIEKNDDTDQSQSNIQNTYSNLNDDYIVKLQPKQQKQDNKFNFTQLNVSKNCKQQKLEDDQQNDSFTLDTEQQKWVENVPKLNQQQNQPEQKINQNFNELMVSQLTTTKQNKQKIEKEQATVFDAAKHQKKVQENIQQVNAQKISKQNKFDNNNVVMESVVNIESIDHEKKVGYIQVKAATKKIQNKQNKVEEKYVKFDVQPVINNKQNQQDTQRQEQLSNEQQSKELQKIEQSNSQEVLVSDNVDLDFLQDNNNEKQTDDAETSQSSIRQSQDVKSSNIDKYQNKGKHEESEISPVQNTKQQDEFGNTVGEDSPDGLQKQMIPLKQLDQYGNSLVTPTRNNEIKDALLDQFDNTDVRSTLDNKLRDEYDNSIYSQNQVEQKLVDQFNNTILSNQDNTNRQIQNSQFLSPSKKIKDQFGNSLISDSDVSKQLEVQLNIYQPPNVFNNANSIDLNQNQTQKTKGKISDLEKLSEDILHEENYNEQQQNLQPQQPTEQQNEQEQQKTFDFFNDNIKFF